MHETLIPSLVVGDREIGPGRPAYVIAEMSGNHGGDFDRAVGLVRAAKDAGADAVKIQTYRPDTMTIDSDKPSFRVGAGTLWEGRSLYDLYGEAMTPWEWHDALRAVADEVSIDFFSTPFDVTAADHLEAMDVPLYKIASFEIVDLELIAHVAAKGKPMIMSTGMATVSEIDEAVSTARRHGAPSVALLRCSSAYPAPQDEMDLHSIPHMAAVWGLPVGLSDHTLGVTAAISAVALGACIVEKHFTDSRSRPGPDSAFSAEPHEVRALVTAIREAEAALGSVRFGPSESERASLVFRRSIFAVADIPEGQLLTRANVRVIRPGHGLPPRELPGVLGRRAAKDIAAGTPLSWDLLG